MSKPTHKTYRFRTFQELVDVVPSDRIRECMNELGELFAVAKGTVELTMAVAQDMGVELPDDPPRIIELPDSFEWIDDGNRELTAHLKKPDGSKFVDVEVRPEGGEQ